MTTTPTYFGLDISKATLDLSPQPGNNPQCFSHDDQGCRRLLKFLARSQGPVQVICEATGGYERLVLTVLAQANVPVTLLNPRRARDFARATGLLAKTDRLDAAMLAEYGRRLQPAPTPPTTDCQKKLEALVARRQQISGLLQQEQVRFEHQDEPFVRREARRLIRTLEKHLAQVEEHIAQWIQSQSHLQTKVEQMTSIKGIGHRTAWLLLAALPELGTLARGQAAALAGVAPYNYDSGPLRGQRHIAHGRPLARRALYMAALVASRHNTVLKSIYTRLLGRGKPPKVALVALMRKLVERANQLLRPPNSQLIESAASSEPQLAPPTA